MGSNLYRGTLPEQPQSGQAALPAGFDGEFTVRYAPPWYWYASAWLSLAAVLALVLKKVGGFLPSHAVQKEKIGV